MMTDRFIKNDQLNFIKKQIALIKDSKKKNVPQNILDAVVSLANVKILDLFPDKSTGISEMLDLSKLKTDREYEVYVQRLEDCLLPFPQITESQLKKLFPKQKKLKLPDLSSIDHNKAHLFKLGTNLRSNKKFIIYEMGGENGRYRMSACTDQHEKYLFLY